MGSLRGGALGRMGAVLHRIAVGALVRDHQVLLCHRRADKAWYPDVWDFAGGHIEPDETAAQALARELQEELGVEVDASLPALDRWVSDDEDMTIFRVDRWSGTPYNRAADEHDDVRWFGLDAALACELPDPRYHELLRTLLT